MSILKMSNLVPQTVILLLLSVHIFAYPAAEAASNKPQDEHLDEEPLDAESSDFVLMEHNANYDMLASDYYDHHPAESIQYQNFAEFYDPHMTGNNDLNMEESNQFLVSTPIRAPQPLSSKEKRIRQQLERVDDGHGRKPMLHLMKGSSLPHPVLTQWDQFDYDKHSMNPGNNKNYVRG